MLAILNPLAAVNALISSTSFPYLAAVPDYVSQVIPYFIVLIVAENVVKALRGRQLARLDDAISSVSAGVVSQIPLLFGRSVEVVLYCWLHQHCCLYPLAWDWPGTWLAGFLGVELAYYWLHRISHEVNLCWIGHQVHHSSEEYDLSTALRQSLFQRFLGFYVYLPLALFVPPAIFVVHFQFNLIYQFWIHTEEIGDLGPLEWILNTPSHHRVHHGRNPYCIDKNYGGTLIIFDLMFGTFAKERSNETLAYGLVHPIESFCPVLIQAHHLIYLSNLLPTHRTVTGKLRALFFGPGWTVGNPRLGDPASLPEVESSKPRQQLVVYRPTSPTGVKAYCLLQFVVTLIQFELASHFKHDLLLFHAALVTIYFVWTLTAIGRLLDSRTFDNGLNLELSRLGVVLTIAVLGLSANLGWTRVCLANLVVAAASMGFWIRWMHFKNL